MPSRKSIAAIATAFMLLVSLASPALAVDTSDRGVVPPGPVDCETDPDHRRCQLNCELTPEHPRCQDPVDRCQGDTDNHRRCLERPDYRQLFWRIINAGDWKMLIRLLTHLGLI